MENLTQKGEEEKVKQEQAYVLDLTKIEGNGDLSCPKCGIAISPDDETEEVYSILKSKVKGQILEEIVIQCNRCASQIHLTGFPLLKKLCI
jgi:DNA-directed RNA polymerase subunit RPC12/RpoP